MNCQELISLLDDGDIRSVPAAKRRELDMHLSQCADCAAEWRVQERIVMTPAMRVPAGFVAQCRQLVAAGAARLLVRRRALLYSSLAVMAAAAALLTWHHGTPLANPSVTAAPLPPIDPPTQAPAQIQPAPQPMPPPTKPQPVANPPGTFSVTVRPLQFESIDPEGDALAARFRERVMALLQDVPNLVLVDSPPVPGATVAEYELRMTYESPVAAPSSRSVKLEVGKSSEFAATQAAIAAEAGMSPEEQQRSRLQRQLADIQKRVGPERNGNTGLQLMLGSGTPTVAAIHDPLMPDRLESAAHQLVRNLRVKVFPLDATFEAEQLATLRNPSERQARRMQALAALLLYAERRGGFSRATANVIHAGAEFAFVWESTSSYNRGVIWDALALTGSPELVPYLIRGLDEAPQTETRLQLVKILTETYGDDPRAQAALAAAANSNDQQTVRMAAVREAGDPRWREYVVTTLGNPALSITQRLQPIADMAPGEAAELGTSPRTKMVLEAQQLRELGALIITVAPDHTTNEIARKALFAAGAMDTPAALDMLIEVADALRAENFARGLEGVSVMGLRQTAHSLISSRYASHPKARAAIEELARGADGLDKIMAQGQLQIMDMKAQMENARQDQQPAQ